MKRYSSLFFVPIFLMSVNASIFRFAREELKHPTEVGALFECSSRVGDELVRYLKMQKGPRRVVELGAGMGAITTVLVKKYLTNNDYLDVIEINPQYCTELYNLFPKEQYPFVHIHCADVSTFKTDVPYDFILCTLPFNVFDRTLISNMQAAIKAMSKPGTYYAYVEYMWFGRLKRLFARGERGCDLQARYELVDQFKQKYLVCTRPVWLNLFPLYVHHLKF